MYYNEYLLLVVYSKKFLPHLFFFFFFFDGFPAQVLGVVCSNEGTTDNTALPLKTCTEIKEVGSMGALHTMAVCHHIGMVKGEMLGDPLEIVSLAFTGGVQTTTRLTNGTTRDGIMLNGILRFVILARFQFQAELQRMVCVMFLRKLVL